MSALDSWTFTGVILPARVLVMAPPLPKPAWLWQEPRAADRDLIRLPYYAISASIRAPATALPIVSIT